MGKIAPGGVVPVRRAPTTEVVNAEMSPVENYMVIAVSRIQKLLAGLARQLQDLTKPVDEYSIVSSYTPAGESVLEVLPTFDTINEKIESIFITGPPTTAFTLQLGDRTWTLTTDVSGKVIIAPVGIMLSRNDRRILTSAVNGNWNLELMGHADERF
jgi:hypothetical protein